MNLDYCRTFKSETKFMNSSYPQLPTPVVGVPRRCCCSPPGQSRASWAFGDWRLEGWLEISTPTDAVIWERQQETVWNRRERGRSWFISTSVEGRCGTNLFGDSCIYISWFEDQFFFFFLKNFHKAAWSMLLHPVTDRRTTLWSARSPPYSPHVKYTSVGEEGYYYSHYRVKKTDNKLPLLSLVRSTP